MPIYEYSCRHCGHAFDALQKLSEAPLTICPECGQPQLKKLVSAPSFRLKGSGWYETDFKKDKRRNVAEGSEGGAAKEGDAKPAADGKDKPADKDKADKTGKADKPASPPGAKVSEPAA